MTTSLNKYYYYYFVQLFWNKAFEDRCTSFQVPYAIPVTHNRPQPEASPYPFLIHVTKFLTVWALSLDAGSLMTLLKLLAYIMKYINRTQIKLTKQTPIQYSYSIIYYIHLFTVSECVAATTMFRNISIKVIFTWILLASHKKHYKTQFLK